MTCGLHLRHIIIYTVIALFATGNAHANAYPPRNSDYIDSVDAYLSRAHDYTDNVMVHLMQQRAKLPGLSPEQRLRNIATIGAEYEQISIDSALVVYNNGAEYAKSIGNQRYTNIFNYHKGSVLTMMGMVREGIELFNSVAPDQIPTADKYDYFSTGHHIYDAAVEYYSLDSLKTKYITLSNASADSTLKYVTPGSVEERYFRALPKLQTAEHSIGIAELTDVMDRVDLHNPLFAKAAAEIANAASLRGETATARYYLAISAIGDLSAGTREATSLHRLGRVLYNEKDYERAYDYLTYSLEAATASGSRLRSLEISEIMPMVVHAGRELESQRTRTLTIVVITLAVAILIVLVILLYAFHTHRRLRRMQAELAMMNDSKDVYIRKLLQLCGAYLTALENFNILAGRKIKVGQIHDLLLMIESGKVIREQLQTFYEVFDDAFLSVYPDFVDNVNALLLPDRKLALTDDGRLSTELRILAFMRLGLDDSAQIAKFLGLSLNTVYTYRNKVKTRAKNRTDFENEIRNISK